MSCSCGNIVISGSNADADSIHISAMDKTLVVHKDLIQISHRSIAVRHYEKTSAKIQTNTRLVLKCDECQCSYTIFFSRLPIGEAYLYQNQEIAAKRSPGAKRMSAPNIAIPLCRSLPGPLQKFVKKQGISQQVGDSPTTASSFAPVGNPFGIEFDPSMEAMFAGKSEIVVGSYKSEWVHDSLYN